METFMDVMDAIMRIKDQNKILIVAHRGVSGGAIQFNTIPAYETALWHKADIIEVDAAMTTDGVFYAFHDGTESPVLGCTQNIRTMDSAYVDQLFINNSSFEKTNERVNRLKDVFDHLRGRCIINVDRAWFYWMEIIKFIQDQGMTGQVILKSHPKKEELEILEQLAPDIVYMAMVRTIEEWEITRHYKINCPMVELLFSTLESPVIQDSFLEKLRREKILLWGNPLFLNDWTIQNAGKNDYHAIMGDPDGNWGWYVEKGFDILQTEWPLLLRQYLQNKGRG
jgi:glycerophosphoryl diester phosphodiesterase